MTNAVQLKKKPKRRTVKSLRGPRTAADQSTGKWRLTIREIEYGARGYRWKTFLVQGWQDERGRWCRKKFKEREAAEAFVALKRVELATADRLQPVLTTLNSEQVRTAELAFKRLKEMERVTGGPVDLLEAVARFGEHLRVNVAVESTSLREARSECIADKERSGKMRPRSRDELEISLRAFERWVLLRPRYAEQSIDPDWTPPVSEITREDIVGYLDSLRSREGLPASGKTRNNARGDLHGFFDWCRGRHRGRALPGVARRWCGENPVADVPKVTANLAVPEVLSLEAAAAFMRHVEKLKDGSLVPFFALALFAGLRPGRAGELQKLAVHPNLLKPAKEAGGRPLVDLERGVITVPASVAKTGRRRVVTIQPNLRAWLSRYGVEKILPDGFETAVRKVRKDCALGHDVLRHSFISYHVGAFGSKGRTALEAGNSEAIIDTHYLNLPTEKEGKAFFAIVPSVGQEKRPRQK